LIKILFFSLTFFSQVFCVFGSDFKIKSHRTYANESEGSFPIVIIDENGNNELAIEFDIESNFQPDLIIEFYFCDKNWKPYESYFFSNQGSNIAYNLWYDTLPVSVEGANYHFKGTFPNFDVTFPFSGKWIYYVVDNTNNTALATGKFFVVQPEVKLQGRLYQDRLNDLDMANSLPEKTFRVSVDFNLPDELFPGEVDCVEIIENQVIDYPYIIDRYEYNNLRYIEWDASKRFTFVAKDIIAGNEYRTTDFSDARRFFQPVLNANIDGFDISRNYFHARPDNNGRSRLVNFSNDNADYIPVNFRLQPSERIKDDIFLIGSFNNWKVLPEYKLARDDERFELNIELKRGRYDYQYVTGNLADGFVENVNWSRIEGNFWETKSDYHIFLFYNSTELGGYDKIIGYYKLSGGVK